MFKVQPPGQQGQQGQQVAEARLGYDMHGRVQARLNDVGRGPSPYHVVPQQHLSRADIAGIRALHAQLEGDHAFSTLAAPMALSRAVRRATQQSPNLRPVSYRSVMANLELDGSALLRQYGGGNCISLADSMQQALAERFGLEAYVVGSSETKLLVQRETVAGVLPMRQSDRVAQHLQGLLHTNVVVPYLDRHDRTQFLEIFLGAGVQDDSVARLTPMEVQERLQTQADATVQRPQRLAVDALAGPDKLHMHDPSRGVTFGIDLVRGIAYLNTAAAARTGQAEPVVELDLKRRTSTRRARTFWAGVQAIFDLDRSAMRDLQFLASTYARYRDEVVRDVSPMLLAVVADRDPALKAMRATAASLRAALNVPADVHQAASQAWRHGAAAMQAADSAAAEAEQRETTAHLKRDIREVKEPPARRQRRLRAGSDAPGGRGQGVGASASPRGGAPVWVRSASAKMPQSADGRRWAQMGADGRR